MTDQETNWYEERKQRRIERFGELAEKADAKSEQFYNEAREMGRMIPFGQPILLGHHSEKGDCAFRKRMWNKQDRSCEEARKAEHYRQKAEAARRNRAISSDDPEAVVKLKAKIEKAEKLQEAMKATNRVVRSKPKNERTDAKIEKIVALGVSENTAERCFIPDFCGRIGFPNYALTNNNANIRRMKQRLEEIESNAERGPGDDCLTEAYDGFQVVENREENRIQIIFDGKAEYFRLCKDKGINLKREGFRYAKSTGAWQRHLNNAGRNAVQRVVERMLAE